MNKNKNGYVPQPVDTSAVVIDDRLMQLCERLSENCHDVWAVGKMKQGFVYGEVTDNEAKTHKDLKPYGELSETAKDYDRNTSIETIRLLIALGWTLIPPAEE